MIHTASVYDKSKPSGLRILTMRHWPRGVPKTAVDAWFKELGSSKELLAAWHERTISWKQFESRHRKEMSRQSATLRKTKDLEKAHGEIVLLCWERIPPHEHCHRFLPKDILETMGGE